PPPLRSPPTAGTPRPAPAAPARAAAPRSTSRPTSRPPPQPTSRPTLRPPPRRAAPARSSQQVSRRRAHHLPHLDRHVQRLAARPRCRRRPRRDLVRPLWPLDIDDPVPCEELLRLGKHPVGDRLAVAPCPHPLRLVGPGQPFRRHQLPRRLQRLRKVLHE